MKIFSTIIFSLVVLHSVFGQERLISGRLTSTEDGSPLPGVNISIKGANRGTITDADGNYAINVPIGGTLVFSFIGMQSREVVVTEDNLQPSIPIPQSRREKRNKKNATATGLPRSFYQDSVPKNQIGSATLTDDLPSYNAKSNIDPSAIRSIRKIGKNYFIISDSDPIRRSGFGLQFSSAISFETVNKLPSLQSQYAQGQTADGSNQWYGADQNEIFSWGPDIRTLEFDGVNYPFDKNGSLVPAGSGNGQQSKKYESLNFFKTGLSNVHEVILTLPGPGNSTMIFDVENRHRSGVIPNSRYGKTNIGASLKNFKVSEHLSANSSVHYNQSESTLASRGANLASIVGSVYRTPVTFDNANTLSRSAIRNESYEFGDGSNRSHAPLFADNPYGLVNELPDREKTERLMGSFNINYSPTGPFRIVLNANIDKQRNESIFGSAPGYSAFPAGRLTERIEDQTFINGILTPSYQINYSSGELKLSASYQTQFTSTDLTRIDGYSFTENSFGRINEAGSMQYFKKDATRITNEVIVHANYEHHDWLKAKFSNRAYFSSTIERSQFDNFFPSASVSIDFARLLSIWTFDNLSVYAIGTRTIREAPLVYSNWSYGSTFTSIESYSSFFENSELLFSDNLAPETERKFETGIKLQAVNSRVTLDVSYFNNQTENFIAPANGDAGFALTNLANIKNYGATISAGYYGYFYNGNWGTDVRWSKHNSIVSELFSAQQWIPLAGFESTQTVLAEGKPLGAIYGTSFLRDSDGRRIIADDGFPVEDQKLKMIGNPIPDWTLGWSGYVKLRRFGFSFLFEVKSGGDIWNGTNASLDYLGRSSRSGSERNIANHIFDGVSLTGESNITPVMFSNPDQPVSANRWVRYGWDGIAEDYIEDASWLRLSELVLSYVIKSSYQSKVKEIKLSLIARNLFVITPYSGVDPAATLFGYSTGSGLDLFNAPSTRSYGAQVTLKI